MLRKSAQKLPRNYKWYRLDNAAIIVPSTSHGSDTRVFRITCELKEEVDPVFLQEALDLTLAEFPHFNVVLRKGLFWYYFDSTSKRCQVAKDELPACSALYYPGRRSLLYRVVYFNRRISLEMFHALADGTGALIFFRKLVANYLCLVHGLRIHEGEHERSSTGDKAMDAFRQYHEAALDAPHKKRAQLDELTGKKAYRIPQDRDLSMQCHCIEGTVSAAAFAKIAAQHGATVGIFIVAFYIKAVLEGMAASEKKDPIVISVPVNLRQFFHSDTTRNFFGVITVTYNAKDYDGTMDSILPKVKESFARQLTPESIRRTMDGYSALVHNVAIQAIPLVIKDLAIAHYFYRSKRGTTATLSNLGRIQMPAETVPYIDKFSAFMSTPNMQICISTFGDQMVFGAVTAFAEYHLLPRFFRMLSELGLDIVIGSNDYDKMQN